MAIIIAQNTSRRRRWIASCTSLRPLAAEAMTKVRMSLAQM